MCITHIKVAFGDFYFHPHVFFVFDIALLLHFLCGETYASTHLLSFASVLSELPEAWRQMRLFILAYVGLCECIYINLLLDYSILEFGPLTIACALHIE